MSFEDDIRRIYEREKNEHGMRLMKEQNTMLCKYEFESFEEWKKETRCAIEVIYLEEDMNRTSFGVCNNEN